MFARRNRSVRKKRKNEKNTAMAQALVQTLSDLQKHQIRVEYAEPDAALPIGESKIGGNPDVPEGFSFPYYEGEGMDDTVKNRPLSFLAQIDLKGAAKYDEEGLLPRSGLLSFFYELDSQKWGFDPRDKGCARMFYFPEGTQLVRTPLPGELAEEYRVPELAVTLKREISLPDWEDFSEQQVSAELEKQFDGWKDWVLEDENYENARTALGLNPEEDEVTKLLGWPDVIQNAMQEECEIVTRGYYTGDPEGYAKIPQSEKPDIAEKSRDWLLLFQMDTVETEASELMFGDCGRIYFWIRNQDLEKQNFDNIWLIGQCY